MKRVWGSWSVSSLFSVIAFGGLLALIQPTDVRADAPGAPGIAHTWAPARKDAVGTAYETSSIPRSPVWFTVAEGVLTETFYPSIDQAQNGDLQFIVVDPKTGFFSEQRKDIPAQISYSGDGSVVTTAGTHPTGAYEIRQTFVTDSEDPVIRMRVNVKFPSAMTASRPEVYLLWKPALKNEGGNVIGQAPRGEGLTATTGPRSALKDGQREFSPAAAYLRLKEGTFDHASAGYVGTSDGWQQLRRDSTLGNERWERAGPGNVALVAQIPESALKKGEFEILLGYGPDAAAAKAATLRSAQREFNQVAAQYSAGWESYLASLDATKPGEFFRKPLARRSAVTLKMHEDKFTKGAVIASLSKPAIPGGSRAHEKTGGYHLVWPRDLYHSAMGMLAAGDARGALDSLELLVKMQKPDGSWHQNFWLDGSPYWRSIQMDQIGFPILIAWHLQKRGVLLRDERVIDMIRRAADFIVRYGPTTQQDRWEEIGGYVPHAIGTQIAGLRAASAMLGESHYAKTAQSFSEQLERWTLVPKGPHGLNYYLRVSTTGRPEKRERIGIANGGGEAWADEILDGGFLELVRNGVRRWDAAPIRSTLAIYDREASGVAGGCAASPDGACQYLRYNRDAYGQSARGGYWPLLAGERGHYAIVAGDFARAQAQMAAIERSALPSGMIPEQTIAPASASGDTAANVSLGAATPLAWAHAEALLLYRSLEERAVFDAVDLEIR